MQTRWPVARARLGIAGFVLTLAALLPFEATAQTPFVPYYGKNRVKYDNFNWHIYTTDHFEIYYYPEIEIIHYDDPGLSSLGR